LRTISISYDRREYSRGIEGLLPYLEHHALRSFIGDYIRDFGWTPISEDLALQLTHLKLERSNIAPSSLANLLKCCPVLEYLMYEHDESWTNEVQFIPSKFSEAIEHLKPSLRELVLYRSEKSQASFDELSTIGSLAEFENLTSLSITAHLLLGPQRIENSGFWKAAAQFDTLPSQPLVKCLPKSLEKLKLKNCGYDILKDVSELADQKNMVTPKLKSVVLWFVDFDSSKHFGDFKDKVVRREMTHQGYNEGEVARLEREFREIGVELDIWYN